MLFARQSTAIIVTVGPVLDSTGVAVTDSVVGDFLISKNGAAPAALNGSATLTHRHTGNYSLSLTATDVNTVGTVEITCSDTTNACPIKEIQVIEEAAYDVMFAASAPGPASPTNITAGTITTATNVTTVNGLAAGVITAASIATGAIDADAIATDAVTEIQSGLATSAALATVDTVVDSILVDTAEIGVAGAGLTALGDARIANLDATVSSRLATAGYTAPDNANIALIKTDTTAILVDTGTTLDAAIAAVKADTAATLIDTAEIGVAGAGLTALATQASVNTIDDFLDTEVSAIKAKTDQLTFTVANVVDSNTQNVNDVPIVGNGSTIPFNV